MGNRKNRRKWTLDVIQKEALKYKTKSSFERGSPNAYNAALKHKLIDKVSKHMTPLQKPHRYWNESRVLNEAKKYKSIGDFREACSSGYSAAKKLKLTKALRKILNPRAPKKIWTERAIAVESIKYSTIRDFRLNAPGAHSAAQKSGQIKEIKNKMNPIGNRYRRAIYAFEFDGKSVYVGLTFDYDQRLQQHLEKGRLKGLFKIKSWKYRKFDKWYSIKGAQKQEALIIEKYRKNGWKILNRALPGALGGGRAKWTKEKALELALKCKSIKEFRTRYPQAVQFAYANGCYSEITNHLTRMRSKRVNWDWTKIKSLAAKYKSYLSFIRAERNAYAYIQRRGYILRVKSLFS